MLIKNFSKLATSHLRKDCLEILNAGVEAVLPENIMPRKLRCSNKTLFVDGHMFRFERLFVVGAGKAAAGMATVFEKIVTPQKIVAGVVNAPGVRSTSKIEVVKAGHPLPDRKGVAGTIKMLSLKREYGIGEGDLVVCLLSGGGSSLMPYPAKGLSLSDNIRVTRLLLSSGAPIKEINDVRKHLSRVKGGQLAQHFSPARVVSIVISDVIGNNLGSIASGPTVADSSSYRDAEMFLKKYLPIEKIPKSILGHITSGTDGRVPDTPRRVANARNYIIADNRAALAKMHGMARRRGYEVKAITATIAGDADLVAKKISNHVLSRKVRRPVAYLFGGETTVVLPKKHGSGGRNRQFVASALKNLLDAEQEFCIGAMASDGIDFDRFAGAIIDNNTCHEVKKKQIRVEHFVKMHDSHGLFRLLNAQIYTGYTGTNVCDLGVCLTK